MKQNENSPTCETEAPNSPLRVISKHMRLVHVTQQQLVHRDAALEQVAGSLTSPIFPRSPKNSGYVHDFDTEGLCQTGSESGIARSVDRPLPPPETYVREELTAHVKDWPAEVLEQMVCSFS
ncbi:hypothetical protein EVAR_67392_1 [Eumeta japonica]|uniref:Uncharacterized protein n=1 Tax=Eumeta variegata TaxID=151549 RepID=A0A4C2A0Y7_EUMVA|nr:hypothetical protein EVAR_67392_1 [Eumeta japonica]